MYVCLHDDHDPVWGSQLTNILFGFCQDIFDTADVTWNLGKSAIYVPEQFGACRDEILQSLGIATQLHGCPSFGMEKPSGLLSLEVCDGCNRFAFIWFKETFSAEAANKNAATPHQQNRARCHSLKRGRQVTIDSEHETVGQGNDWQRSTKILKDWGGTGPEQDLPSPSFTKPLATNAASKRLRYGHSQDSQDNHPP